MEELDFTYIGKRIKEIRTSNHLTQEFVAKSAGVNVSHISNIENDRVKISLTLLVKICNALGVSLDYLLQNEYHDPNIGIETELLMLMKELPKDKKEALLRIARVL